MANLLPPVLCDSPPPLDGDLDDSDDLVYSELRVPSELGLDFSDNFRESPEIWLSPSHTKERFDGKVTDNQGTLQCNVDDVPYLESITQSTMPDISTIDKADRLVNCDSHSNDNELDEVPGCDKESHYTIDNLDSLEIIKELETIPLSKLEFCDTELEARTSPEGADAEYTANEFESIPPRINESAQDTIVESSEPIETHTEHDNKIEVSKNNGNGKSNPIECSDLSKSLPELHVDDLSNALDDNFDDEFDDFADFTDFSSQPLANKITHSSAPSASATDLQPNFLPEDDFDEFESAAPPVSQDTSAEDKDLKTRLSEIFCRPGTDIAVCEDGELTLCLNTCLDDSSSVWGHLKDLDTSPALNLQWASSSASRRLLAALSVDSRNILIGPRWNPLLPRYAANLSGVPLEPVIAAPEPAPPPPVQHFNEPPIEDVVPAAQFDWMSSGLTNPLDFSPSSLLDLDFLIKFDNVSSSPNAASDVWTPYFSAEKETPLRDQQGQLTVIEKSLPTAASDLWLPSGDFSLPVKHPVVDRVVVISKPDNKTEQGEWSSVPSERPIGNMMTISSRFESLWRDDELSNNTMIPSLPDVKHSNTNDGGSLSAEAFRVVESLPDLSFLSARNLLYTANENVSRFTVTHARN